ncbi:amidase [Sphingomonas colocasiae]|uniref:Amidase n=1 Tax=Sphingomonas colocasiae TaxID=1848973 RepID=A0ABS7PLD8_9SPHN|nr:amidase family protein [Sphingomonas colocasiae]MBY8822128.1 amidase [Sphingomonas colocasiae]
MRTPWLLTALLIAAAPAATAAADRGAAKVEVFEASIPDLQAAMAERRVTSRQLVQAYLDRIAAYDHQGPALNAIVTLNPNALEEAAALDRERAEKGPRGPLHGIPVLVKDNYATADMPTSAGTLALATYRTKVDAFQVKRLRDAGAIILGKTTMHELAMSVMTVASLTGETRNPYDPRRSPGGSSGGTGASIGASFAAAGMGSDTCGSIRVPAAYQSLFGMRGTAGLSSRAGVIPLSSRQDEAGPMTRGVTDLAIMMDATVGVDPADPVTAAMKGRPAPAYAAGLRPGALKGARIGVLRALLTPELFDGAMRDKTNEALEAMKAQGAELVDVALPDLEPVLKAASVIAHEFRFDFADYLAKHPGAPVASIADMAGKGLTHEAIDARLKIRATTDKRDEKAYAEALAKRDVARKMILDAMEKAKVDVLAYPSAMQPPLFWGAEAFGTGTCAMSSETGLPAMSIPLGLSANALPVGLDLLGRPFDEQRLLNLAYGWEQAAHPRTPPFSTPALVNGKAPGASRFTVKTVAEKPAGAPSANIAFTYDPLTADLRFDARIAGLGRDEPVALTLQRSDEGKPGAVIALLLRAGQRAGASEIRLDTRARADLAAGRLFVHLYTRDHPLGAGRVALPAR